MLQNSQIAEKTIMTMGEGTDYEFDKMPERTHVQYTKARKYVSILQHGSKYSCTQERGASSENKRRRR